MERKDQPILIVDETRINFLLDVFRLAVELGAYVCNLHRIARLVFSLKGHSVGFGLPGPCPGRLELECRDVYVEGVADRFELPKRIQTKSFGGLFGNWRFLCPGGCRN